MMTVVTTLATVLDGVDGVTADTVRAWHRDHPACPIVAVPPACEWPFRHPLSGPPPAGASMVWLASMDAAFANAQTGGTRLVTTQPSYLIEAWHAWRGGREDVLLVGLATEETIARLRLPPAFALAPLTQRAEFDGDGLLPRAFRAGDAGERLALCVRALDEGRTAPRLVAAASVCMEVNDLDAAARDLEEAIARAPEWAAAHFEHGKLWLRRDDMEQASAAFRRAADLLPRFAPAWANLGATLGELDRPEEAVQAFEQALAVDPESPQAVNNIGVVQRELGRLPESEASFRRVVALSPHLAFGYYNLGHTLFLQGRYQAALAAYEDGQRRDADRNPVQATRLAMCRLATGDAAGAVADLRQATAHLPPDYRKQLLADTHSIAWALLTHRPDLPGWALVNDWLTRQIGPAAG